ncbi:MAG: SpoIIE family protein phosphatase [Nitrospirota bacterium]
MIDKQKILIADDDPLMLRILTELLEDNGYEVVVAMNGETVINELRKNHYDLLVSDIVMEGIDGIELIKAVRQIDGYQNLPVILLSGKNDSATKVKAFDALADDYVTKPFDLDELAARIKTQLRLKHLQDEIGHKNTLLSQRNAEHETNLEVARRFQFNLLPLNAKEINNLTVSSFYQPIDKVGGDLFDIIPLKNGNVGVFISDVFGHGVPAAFLNIMLKMILRSVVEEEDKNKEDTYPFKVLEKINKKIQQYINDGNFITALYSIIDVNNKMLYISSAGHPKAIIMRKEGNRVSYIESRGLCLGFDSEVKYTTNAVRLYPGDRIIYYTDGLTEMKDKHGRQLGSDGLIEVMKRCSAEVNTDALVTRLVREIDRLRSDKEYDDDITILCLEITDSYYCNWTTSTIDTDHVIKLLINPLHDKLCNDIRVIKKIQVAIHEALTNAINHGNLEIDSGWMYINGDDTMYELIKKERLNNPVYGNRKVTTRYQISDDRIIYHIKDDGSGFNHKNIEDPREPDNLEKFSGRGIALIKMYMDEVSFNDKGNEIRMVKNFPAKTP